MNFSEGKISELINVSQRIKFQIRLQVLLNKAPLTVRLKSLIMNLEYRRRNNWQAPDHANQGPKTLRAIHEEYERLIS